MPSYTRGTPMLPVETKTRYQHLEVIHYIKVIIKHFETWIRLDIFGLDILGLDILGFSCKENQ